MTEIRAGAAALQPFEAMVLPAELDGRAGLNRERHASTVLGVSTDREALERWLAAAHPNGHTRRAYAREAERLLL